MPKPKTGEIYVRELRITPPDQEPITDWQVNDDDFKVLLACQEGGDTKKLHYHLYVECHRSESWLKKWIYNVSRCTNGESGNAVYFSRKPHEHTIGYVVKSGNVVCRHGCTQTYVDEWLAKSHEYKANKERVRKKEQRSRTSVLTAIMESIARDLKGDPRIRSVSYISDTLIKSYRESGVYAMKTQHEMMVMKLIHPYDDYMVRQFYEKHLL